VFKTKIDISDNRQANQSEGSVTRWLGKTDFGTDTEELVEGPDLSTQHILIPEVNNITSTFIGNTITGDYTYSFGYAEMVHGEHLIVPFDLNNSNGDTQDIGPVWVGQNPTVVDGRTIYDSYKGVEFSLTLVEINDLGNGDVSGSTVGMYTVYTAESLQYVGDYIWVNVRGVTQTEKLKIKNVGIGATTKELGVDNSGNVISVASDERLKENIEKIPNALNKLLQLRGVQYNWKDRDGGGNDVRIGFIAQEVEKIIPELVYNTGNDDYLGVYYSNVVALIIEAMKELVSGDTIDKREINVEVIYSEDNSIELNYNGTKSSSLNGGIIIKKGVNENEDSKIIIDNNGDWTILPNIKIKEFTPINSSDGSGNKGNISFDEDYIYIKTNNGWKRTELNNF